MIMQSCMIIMTGCPPDLRKIHGVDWTSRIMHHDRVSI